MERRGRTAHTGKNPCNFSLFVFSLSQYPFFFCLYAPLVRCSCFHWKLSHFIIHEPPKKEKRKFVTLRLQRGDGVF
ncbi:hypothetical protein EVA_05141 [gut metagenome]|uniref:Uncharacterized protein n=1 Tax=gut metagenome TaxID=749906 RepID=J9D2B3_9ZZZZ